MFLSTSAINKHSAESFFKVMLTLCMTKDFDYDAAYKRRFTEWFRDSEDFIAQFRFPTVALRKANDYILKGTDSNVDDKFHEVILRIMDAVNAKKEMLKKELDLRKEDLSFLNDCRLYYTKDSEAALKRLTKNASRFRDSDISAMFVSEHDDTEDEKAELEELVEKHTGMPGHNLPLELLQKWQKHSKEKGTKTKDHMRYLELKRHLNTAYKTRLQSLVRSSGDHMMPVHDVRSILNEEGISNPIPEGFVGFIDDHGKYYTRGRKEMRQTPVGEVSMNPNYDYKKDNTYVCTFIAPGSTKEPSRAYTLDFAGGSKTKKFSIVSDTIPKLGSLRKKWQGEMADLERPKGVLATLVDFVDNTASRVSNDKAQSKGNKTYGATTMLVKHVKITPTQLIVSYQGKSSGDQYHAIKYSGSRLKTRLVNNIKKLIADKKPTDRVFTLHGKGFTGNAVNKYMQHLGFPTGFTIHKFRTVVGIKMATRLLKKSPFKKGGNWKEKEVNDWVKDQMMKIGEKLGHNNNGKVTPNTAIQNYIEPGILDNFYSRLGIRPSSAIQKAIDSIR